MPSFSSLVTHLTDIGFYYEKNPRHATYNFGQEGQSLYRNNPRFPFEYYININLNNVGTAKGFIDNFFNQPSWAQVQPLIKSVEMPSMKIETTPLNQYNRKRLSQTKIAFEPVKLVFHDVADGKTLKFWDMYYRYYFADGVEAGVNEPRIPLFKGGESPFNTESLIAGAKSLIPKLNPNIANLPSSIKNIFKSVGKPDQDISLPSNTLGQKRSISNILGPTLVNHNFGFNVDTVRNVRNLIQTIEIFQVHGGRFNMVTLVNPRISAFTHDVLSYADNAKTLELTFTFEYEYAFYNIQNLELVKGQSSDENNPGSLEQFKHGEFLELPALAFNAKLLDFLESNNPLLNSDNPILQRIGKNVQTSIGGVTGAFMSDKVVRRVGASALDNMAQILPTPYHPTGKQPPLARSFVSSARNITSNAYKDISRVGNPLK